MATLAAPLALLLLPLPFLAARLLPAASRTPEAALRVPETIADAFEGRGASSDRPGRGRQAWLPWLCWAALVVALAGPEVALPMRALPTSGREIYLALDISGSMRREDFVLDGRTASRLDTVKAVAADFVERRAGDRIGLVFFAEQTYVAAPASFDLALVKHALSEATIGVVGTSTAIGDGLGLALKRLRGSDAAARLVILLSDGANTAGKVRSEDAARLAGEFGIRVHTIGLGTEDKTARLVGANADEVDFPNLQAIATASGGQAFRVRTTDELAQVYRAIEALEASGATAPPAAVTRNFWPYPAALAFLAALGCLWQAKRGGP